MPPTDNTAALRQHEARRRAEKTAAVKAAIRRLEEKGERLSFKVVADEAGVARSWLYASPDLRKEIESRRTSGPVPKRQKVSPDSSEALLKLARAEIKRLQEENRLLRQEMEQVLGNVRFLRT